jgi:hypothetical protein
MVVGLVSIKVDLKLGYKLQVYACFSSYIYMLASSCG